jgi:tripartite-type tricarboxylate transporter receptor subunit TctC
MKRLTLIVVAVSAVAAASAPLCLFAQPSSPAYPSKPIKMVLPFSGGTDALVRLVAQKISEPLGQPVIVESVLGAGGAISAEQVARAAPDGYTILLGTPDPIVNRPIFVKVMRYDPVKDFTPLSLIVETIAVIAAHPSVPVTTLKELIAYAKANPGKLAYGTSGAGTTWQLVGESFKLITGTDMLHVPFKSGVEALTASLSGQIPLVMTTFTSVWPHAKTGKLRLLTVINDRRYHTAPDVPAMQEVVPGFQSPAFWLGYLAPAGLAGAVSRRLNMEIVKAMGLSDIRAKFDEFGFVAIGSTQEEFAARIKSDIERSRNIARAAGIQPE